MLASHQEGGTTTSPRSTAVQETSGRYIPFFLEKRTRRIHNPSTRRRNHIQSQHKQLKCHFRYPSWGLLWMWRLWFFVFHHYHYQQQQSDTRKGERSIVVLKPMVADEGLEKQEEGVGGMVSSFSRIFRHLYLYLCPYDVRRPKSTTPMVYAKSSFRKPSTSSSCYSFFLRCVWAPEKNNNQSISGWHEKRRHPEYSKSKYV